jgi:hypothetical protein
MKYFFWNFCACLCWSGVEHTYKEGIYDAKIGSTLNGKTEVTQKWSFHSSARKSRSYN